MTTFPSSNELIANVLSQAIVGLTTWSLRSSYQMGNGDRESFDLSEIIRGTVTQALKPIAEVETMASELGGEQFRSFLASPDVFNLLQRLFVAELQGVDGVTDRAADEFLLSWASWVKRPPDALQPHLGRIFEPLADAVRSAAETAAEHGYAGIDALHFHGTLIAQQLASIDQRLAFFANERPIEKYHEFEAKYREQVRNRHSQITPPHIDDARRVPLAKIYVEPEFLMRRGKAWSEVRLSLDAVRRSILRTVVLGQPGGGKSTFTIKLCSDLASRYEDCLVGGISLTPILVVLRDYGIAKSERHLSLLDFIAETASADYQLSPPSGAFEYMMEQGRALVVFDGLDELVDPSRRQHIRDDIESFCSRFPAVRVLVTAREIGYEQAPLDVDDFVTLGLSEFGDEQVEQYVNKWFAAHPDVPSTQRDRQVDAFLKESERVVSDLRRNPLLLALMCNIYKGEGYIPTNRPEVYEKCSNMLLRRWDASRGIHVSRPLGAHLERTLHHLAHWIFRNADLQGGVPERKLLDVASRYLAEKRFEDDEDASFEAQNFLDFCKGRAWVLVEVGTSNRQPLFQFAHRTFLEYFTAEYLVRNSEGPRQLGLSLLSKMGQASWDVVVQLAFQIQHAYREDAGDELLELSLDFARPLRTDQQLAALSFAVRSLEFLVPTPRITRAIATAAVDYVLRSTAARANDKSAWRNLNEYGFRLDDFPERVFVDLLGISEENFKIVASVVEETLRRALSSQKKGYAPAAATLTMALADRMFGGGRVGRFGTFAEAILEEQGVRVRRLAAKYDIIARHLLFRKEIDATTVARERGVEVLFAAGPDYVGSWVRMGWAEYLLYGFLDELSPSGEKGGLKEIGDALLGADFPWFGSPRSVNDVRLTRMGTSSSGPADASPDISFGLFCILMPSMQRRESRDAVLASFGQGSALLARLVALARGRIDGFDEGQAHAAMDGLGWSEEQQMFVLRWLRRRVSTIGRQSGPSRMAGSVV